MTSAAGASLGPASLALALLLAACAAGRSVELPDAGTLRLTTPQTSLAVTVPAAVQGRTRYIGNGVHRFGDPDATPQTTFGSVSAEPANPGVLGGLKARLAGGSDADLLAAYLAGVAAAEPVAAERSGSRPRAHARTSGARPEHAVRGIACVERRVTTENRTVPGQPRRLYLTHTLAYTCIDPRSRTPVELTWSERYRAGTNRLPATFETDARAFFASLRFL